MTSRLTAYDVVVTDVVPTVLAYAPDTLQVTLPSGSVISTTVGNNLTITVTDYPTPSAPITITYTATVIQSAEPASTYTNTAFVRYSSLPDTPDARTGSGVDPNDYYTSTQATIQTAPLTINKTLDNDINYSVGDLITYTVVMPLPTGTTRNLVVTDTVPAGLLRPCANEHGNRHGHAQHHVVVQHYAFHGQRYWGIDSHPAYAGAGQQPDGRQRRADVDAAARRRR